MRRAGVSLVELIVVLLLFSLLVGLVVPALTAVPRNARASAPIDSARALATRNGRPVAIPAGESTSAVLALPDGRVVGGGGADGR